MTDTLTNIQTDVRHWADDGDLDLTTAANLRIANQIYLGMCTPGFIVGGIKIGRRWPEVTREDTSLTMVVSQEQYTWPTSPVMTEPFYIEGLDTNASNLPYAIFPVPDMETWSDFDDTNDAQPLYYRLIDVSGTVKLALRPNPTQTDGIRITGIIEARAFPSTRTSTVDVDSASGQKVLSVAATTPFPAGESVIINEGGTREEKGVVASISAGVSITLAENLSNAHTAAQADTVELLTRFKNFNSDKALAKLIASEFKRKRGDPGRADELVTEARGLLPTEDKTPKLRSFGHIRPWGIM